MAKRTASENPPESQAAQITVHGEIAGVSLDLKLRSPKGGRPLLDLIDQFLNAAGPPAGWKPGGEGDEKKDG